MNDVWRERGARLWLVGRTFEQDMNDPLGDLPVNVDVHAHLKWLETGKGDPFPKAGESFEEAVHDGIWRRSLLQKLVCPLIGDIGIEQLGRNEIGFVLERVLESGRPPSVVRSVFFGLQEVVLSAIERRTRTAPWPASKMARPMWLHVLSEWTRRKSQREDSGAMVAA